MEKKRIVIFTLTSKEQVQVFVYQEIKGIKLPDSEGLFAVDKSPYIPLRWNRLDGENYGRGMCKNILEIYKLRSLTKAIVEVAWQVKCYLWLALMVQQGSQIAQSPNGAIIEGSK